MIDPRAWTQAVLQRMGRGHSHHPWQRLGFMVQSALMLGLLGVLLRGIWAEVRALMVACLSGTVTLERVGELRRVLAWSAAAGVALPIGLALLWWRSTRPLPLAREHWQRSGRHLRIVGLLGFAFLVPGVWVGSGWLAHEVAIAVSLEPGVVGRRIMIAGVMAALGLYGAGVLMACFSGWAHRSHWYAEHSPSPREWQDFVEVRKAADPGLSHSSLGIDSPRSPL